MAQLGIFDLFRVGVGPSSSHTVGPMRAGKAFAEELLDQAANPTSITVDLYGSLAATGIGHGTDRAVLLGLGGADPETVPIAQVEGLVRQLTSTGQLALYGGAQVPFDLPVDVRFNPRETLDFHVNGLTISARLNTGDTLTRTYYSTGGGFVLMQVADEAPKPLRADTEAVGAVADPCPYPFTTGAQLLQQCSKSGQSVAQVAWENEGVRHTRQDTTDYLDHVLDTMFEAVEAGVTTAGILPGGLGVPRRAPQLCRSLEGEYEDPLAVLDWVNLFALAVNEENAAGHRVVTAPTNGAAGVVPAVLGYLLVMRAAGDEGGLGALAKRTELWKLRNLLQRYPKRRQVARDFLMAASAIGSLIKTNASFAGAEVGCQGEVGSASAMAAAGLAQAFGGTPEQVENAAEIAMEHSLGLTCDPVGGLVQIPCIERNAIAAVKAISAARMALYGDGRHRVSLDTAIETMRQTGLDMHANYKETSVGGLAVNFIEC